MYKNGIGRYALLLLLTGCSAQPPSGQVLARVNGEEVTRNDVLVELNALGVPDALPVREAQKAALERIIERKLLVQAARGALVDRSPAYLAKMRRERDILLADSFIDQAAGEVAPAPGRIAAFIARNPHMFSERRMVVIDHIRVSAPLPKGAPWQDDHSLDRIAARLQADGTPFTRYQEIRDSARTGPTAKVTDGAVLARTSKDGVDISMVIASWAVRSSPAQWDQLARETLKAQEAEAGSTRILGALKDDAEIVYQAEDAGRRR